MGRGGVVCTSQPLLLDVVLSGSPPLPGLSISTTHHCSAASVSLFFLLFTPSKAFSDAKRTHTSKPQHAPSRHRQTVTKTDTETDQDAEETHAQDTHTIRKSLTVVLILSALSSLSHPRQVLLAEYTATIQERRYNLYVRGDLE